MKETFYMPEIINKIKEAETEEEKIRIMQSFRDTKGFRHLLYMCYEPAIEWTVARNDVEHLVYDHMDIADYDLAPDNLFLLAPRKIFNYTNVRSPLLTKQKTKNLIAGHFSVMHHEEIELFKQIIDRNIDGLSEGLVRKAFPDMFIAPQETKETETENPVEENPVEENVDPKPKSKTGSKLDKHRKSIFKMINAGATQKEISNKFNVAVGTLRNWLKKHSE